MITSLVILFCSTMIIAEAQQCINGVQRDENICECLFGWTGRFCENPLPSVCDAHPCGSGECLPVVHRSLTHVCLCSNGELGRVCPQEPSSACQSNPCHYGGICYNLTSSYICICPDGSMRKECRPEQRVQLYNDQHQQQHICPCRNGGICMTKGSIQCSCAPGFTGSICENEYFQCLSNGRFTDRYHCHQGKYFECVHSQWNQRGLLLSRVCPSYLRFNVLVDRCDYPENVSCPDLF